ncbi:MAG: 16S rRNA (cytidine(1402)-2'-O)-methyltransferase [Candidatus Eisenbacteria bacterium]|nr:16S rRNA (cytidine(1402)-2'-O)-methyltransferase [Candidatus Latescibacterota bacterium]MBD3301758.1 16S rRNA (cytidine(1402)-2'-O)-methyltransferase [Candidatus Eisenbacteria bacterium]
MNDPESPGPHEGPGVLYLVATPIGNLEDVTLRALRVLREVAWIAAEDTRRTRILLREHDIESKTLISYHAHNERVRLPQLLARLGAGNDGALVTDAGTPAVSDPGFLLAREARSVGIRVEVVPGPSAVLAGLLASGLPCERFVFLGYPPPKGASRSRFIDAFLEEERTVVLFESPHRIEKLVERIVEREPHRPLAICRELTKRFEETLRGTAPELLAELRRRPRKGELTVVVGRREGRDKPESRRRSSA